MSETNESKVSVIDKMNGLNEKVCNLVEKGAALVGDHPWEKWIKTADKAVSAFLPLTIAAVSVIAMLTGLISAVSNNLSAGDAVMFLVCPILSAFVVIQVMPKAIKLIENFYAEAAEDAVRPELLAILKVLFGFGGLVGAFYLMFNGAVGEGFGLLAFAIIALAVLSRPQMIGVKAEKPVSVVDEVATLVTIPLKIVASFLTLISAIAVLGGLVYGIYLACDVVGFVGAVHMWYATLVPVLLALILYVYGLFFYLTFSVIRAIVSIPRKLDK